MSFKKKWENYWYYYKWYTFFAVFIIVVVSVIGYQMMTKTVYDNGIVVAGNVPSTLADIDAFKKDAAPYFADTNNDGEVNLNLTFVPLGTEINSVTDAEFALMYPQQLSALIAADIDNIFIVSEDVLISYGRDKAFSDISHIQEELGLSDCKYDNGLLITNKELIKNLNLYPNVDYYVAVRIHNDMEKMGDAKRIGYENAYKFLKECADK